VSDPRKCIVTFRDGEGVEHAAELTASSLYEAALLALHQFRQSAWSREASFDTGMLRVEVWEPPTVHRVSIADVEKWLNRAGGKPNEVTMRRALRQKLQIRTKGAGDDALH
jgi:hypothetical protein